MPRPVKCREEMVGNKFNYLTLLEHYTKNVADGKSRHFWKCKCDCGKYVDRREDYIINNKTNSCGCKHPRHLNGSKRSQWKGVGELNGHYFSTLKIRAEKHQLEFLVTIDFLWNLFLQQNRKCALTGEELWFSTASNMRKGVEQTASLDRKNSLEGYTPTNVWWVHKDVNKMKNDYQLDRFIEVCNLVTKLYPITTQVD